MKSTVKILSLLLLLGTAMTLLGGCGNDDYCCATYDYYITVINDSPWVVFVEPFGIFLNPRETIDIEIGYDVVRVLVLRDFDGLILAELDMVSGDVLVVH
jgi:hypothetical protein